MRWRHLVLGLIPINNIFGAGYSSVLGVVYSPVTCSSVRRPASGCGSSSWVPSSASSSATWATFQSYSTTYLVYIVYWKSYLGHILKSLNQPRGPHTNGTQRLTPHCNGTSRSPTAPNASPPSPPAPSTLPPLPETARIVFQQLFVSSRISGATSSGRGGGGGGGGVL
jgi:hypothetical protein